MNTQTAPSAHASEDILSDPSRCPAYLNGRMLTLAEAQLPALDRGFLFADGVYEVVPIFNGHLFRWAAHQKRLASSLGGLMFAADAVDLDELAVAARHLAEACPLRHACLYLQISRGSYPIRDHNIPAEVKPTVVMWLTPIPDPSQPLAPVRLMTCEDIRWDWCHLKTVSLLGNVLLRERARQGGCDDALLLREGRAVEATAANLVFVEGESILIPESSEEMLPGITRQVIIDRADALGIDHEIVPPPPLDRVVGAKEAWLCSSTKLMLPIAAIDDHTMEPIDEGGVGARLRASVMELAIHYDPRRDAG